MREDVRAVHDRSRLREEDVVQLLLEHCRAASRRLDERVVVAVRDGRGRRRQERRERAEHERDLVLRDQVLVVRHDLRRAARVVEDLEIDVLAEQTAVRVDDVLPQLVAAHRRFAGIREVARKRQRDSDLHRAPGHRTAGGRRRRRRGRRGDEGRARNRQELQGSTHHETSLSVNQTIEPAGDLGTVLHCVPARFVLDESGARAIASPGASDCQTSQEVPHRGTGHGAHVRADRAAQGLRADRPAGAHPDQRAAAAAR